MMESKDWIKYVKDKKIIAIDPGKEGGIVTYSVDKEEVIDVSHMPETPLALLSHIKHWGVNSVCYLEKVGGLPGMGGSAMFNFGRGFGHIEMALMAAGVPTIEVTPQKWQKALQLGTKGKRTANQWKTYLMEVAQRMYPTVGSYFGLKTKKDWTRVSDALLILDFARLNEKI